ncbi:MAG TPA: D-alanyl-D-alanine carboxypeptidase/D-alanyl-D-alanine-endopeptidase [Pyrinomonadaceae bacterium]|nr:D-alanyl-D-alanine carboxypeptidase/D-alanyl-D-alanine-endopeptidase [Pyrinomonadaceae bacterium]
MKRKLNQIKFLGFLSIVVFCFGSTFTGATAAQENQRSQTRAKPTPTLTPTPNQTLTPRPIVSPVPIVTPTATPVPVQTIADLQSRVRFALSRPEVRRGQIGVKVVSLDTNRVVFEENAEKYFMPASNMKSYTIAAALEKLSPDFRFVTSVYAPAMPDASGLIRGDVTVYGRGDVSLSFAFFDGDYLKGVDNLATAIALAGVKRIEGNLIGDDSYFSGDTLPAGWEWDDLQWNSGAEPSALTVNNNVIDLTVKPSASTGAPCVVQFLPFNPVVRVVNRCTTAPSGAKRDLRVFKKLDQNTIEISGTLSADDKGFSNVVTVSRPSELFLALLRQLLIQKGVVITGQNRVVGAKDKPSPPLAAASNAFVSTAAPVEIAKLASPPLSLIAAKTMKPSQNLYTENILRVLGEQMKTLSAQNPALPPDNPFVNPKADSARRGIFAIQNFLSEIGVAPDSVIQHDGSGLSRHNLVTPASSVQLYSYMARSRYADVWRDTLPIGAVDGTLRNRFAGTSAAGNARAKTGTIDQVSALSGYVTTASGERLVFSIVVNGVAVSSVRQSVIDEIVVALANFNGKSGQ